mmetsp:Transcript_45352/g.82847  ORF Transcript_45352/g.82847 Transcript_45352/m.82847 type:complete len:151 (+) Transcript_45352:10-462(+)
MKIIFALAIICLLFTTPLGFKIRQDGGADGGDAGGDDGSGAAAAGGMNPFDPTQLMAQFQSFMDPSQIQAFLNNFDPSAIVDQMAEAFGNALELYGDAWNSVINANLALWGMPSTDPNDPAAQAQAVIDAAPQNDDGAAADDGAADGAAA